MTRHAYSSSEYKSFPMSGTIPYLVKGKFSEPLETLVYPYVCACLKTYLWHWGILFKINLVDSRALLYGPLSINCSTLPFFQKIEEEKIPEE